MENEEVMDIVQVDQAEPTQDEKMLGLFAHIGTLLGGGIFFPLLIWLLKKDESDFLRHHGKESLNFLITMAIYTVASCILIFLFVGVVLFPTVVVLWYVFCILAGVGAYKGDYYKYPKFLAFSFIK